MSSLLARAFSHRPSFPRLSCIALLVAGIGLASCGGDDDDPPPAPKQADLVGVLHGVLAASLQEELGIGAPLTDMSAAVDTLQDIVLLSDPNGIDDAHPALALMKDALHSGRAVALENVNADEVNALIKALGLRISAFSLPEGASEVELFAVRKVRGDTWFFVDVGTAQGQVQGSAHDTCKAEEYDQWINACGPVQSSEDGQRQQAQCEAATQALTASRTMPATLVRAVQGKNIVHEEAQEEEAVDPCMLPVESTCGTTRTRALLDWAQAGREEAARPQHSVVLSDGYVIKDNDTLHKLVAKNYWQFVYSPGCRSFITKYDTYAYHSFAEDVDYYFISQYGDYTPSRCWKNTPVDCGHLLGIMPDVAKQEGYMRDYEFEHELLGDPRDPKYGLTNPQEFTVTISSEPHTAAIENTIKFETSTTVGGSIGFSLGSDPSPGPAPEQGQIIAGSHGAEASLSASMTTSTALEQTYKDAAVTFSAKGKYGDILNWRYDFLRPCSGNDVHCLWSPLEAALLYHNLNDATGLARGTFNPTQEWIWRVPSQYSRDYFPMPGEEGKAGAQKGFKTYFGGRDGQSTGDVYPAVPVFPVQSVHHTCRMYMGNIWYVPLSRPPLLAANQSGLTEFPVGGQTRSVNLASEYDWKVYEKPDWVKVLPRTGEPTRRMHVNETDWGGSTDLEVTAVPYDAEEYDPRQGTVKICAIPAPGDTSASTDENGCLKDGEKAWITVTQKAFQ